jgi:predicted phage terminase large subunit-like protein
MNNEIRLSPLYEWQRQAWEQFEQSIAAGARLLVLNCGRRSGKTDLLVRFAILSARGAGAGGHVAFCGPSEEHISDPRDWTKHWFAPLITGLNPQGDGYTFATGGTISFVSLSGGKIAPLRGRELSMAIVDEAAHIRSNLINLIEANIMPTLALSRGPLVIGSTPKGVGTDYHQIWVRAGKEGIRFAGPSRMNPNFTPKEEAYYRKTYPPLRFAQEFEAAFVDGTSGLLKRAEVRYGELPAREDLVSVVFGLDPAISEKSTADYTGICVAAVDRQGRRWVAALYMYRLDWPRSLERILQLYEAWKPNLVIVEEVSFQKLAVQQLADFMPVKPIRPEADKLTRFSAVHTYYHTGQVYHSHNLDLEAEQQLFSFPEHEHDDIPDAVTYALGGTKRAWNPNSGSGWAWGSDNTLPHEKPKNIAYGYNYLTGRYDQAVDFDELTALPTAVPKPENDEPMELQRAIAKYIEELVGNFFPAGREAGGCWEIRPGLRVRLVPPIAFIDTQQSASGDFIGCMVHCQVASNREDAQAQVEKFLSGKGVKLTE